MPEDRAAGGVFLWLPFFAQAKKVTRSPVGRVEALYFKKQTNIKIDSRLRGNDEQTEINPRGASAAPRDFWPIHYY